MNVDFDPELFIEATECLAATAEEMVGPNRFRRWSCYALLTLACFDCDTQELNRARHYFVELFVNTEPLGALFLDTETGLIDDKISIEEQQHIRFMCLYLAYLVACDEAGITEQGIAA